MPVYVHHSKKGPDFTWDLGKIAGLLAEVRYNQGRLHGRMEGLASSLREEAENQVQLHESRLMGDARHAAMIREAARQFSHPLTKERLAHWHSELYPSIGETAAPGRVHFQSSVAEGSETKLTKLIHWVNTPADTDPIVKAAVVQLWLVDIRPFATGNERLADLVMESLLARANNSGERFYSVAGQMQTEAREYGEILKEHSARQEHSARPPDITPRIESFLGSMDRAIKSANETLGLILEKDRLLTRSAEMSLNDRQRIALKKMLDEQETKFTSSKWATLTKTSQDTAGRDINDLVRKGILKKESRGGRSTSYTIAMMR